MPLLYYWRRDNYYRDLDFGASFHLNQSSPLLHSLNIGDSLWAFTRNRNNNYVLAAELIVKAKTFNSRNFRYGRYRVWGDLERSRYFSIEEQPNIEHIIRDFSISTNAQILGRAFQGHAAVRQIFIQEHQLLLSYSNNLTLEKRAQLLPEDKLEALLISGDDKAVYSNLLSMQSGISEKRVKYLYTKAPQRNIKLTQELQNIYSGRCQVCKWNPKNKYGHSLCEAHHIRWLSRGGTDELSNLLLVCPNHHRAIHSTDAVFDYESFTLNFEKHFEDLKLNLHL